MKVITDCPICKKDFMYDPNWDQELYREVAWDFYTGECCSYEAICQDCNEKEKKEND
jgi:hypothetical protein